MQEEMGASNRPVSRRRFLGVAAGVTGGIVTGGWLSACGGGDDGGGASTSGGGAASAPESGVGKQLVDILGEPKNLIAEGPGSFPISASLPLTGNDASGKQMLAGWNLGLEHVDAWTSGKLKFDAEIYDNKSGDPQAETQTAREAGLAGSPLFVNSYLWGNGATIPSIDRYKMLAFDPGGGTGPIPGPFSGIPYCYGTREPFPNGMIDGIAKTITTVDPKAKRFAFVSADFGKPYSDAVRSYVVEMCKRQGLELAGFVLAPIAKTDYSSTVEEVKDLSPDATIWMTFGFDAGHQAKQAFELGLDSVNAGIDFTQATADAAGPSYAKWFIGLGYPDVKNPPNQWAKLLQDTYTAKLQSENGPAGNYVYRYYQAAFMYAILMDRVLGAGGDIENADDYIKQIEADPSFPDVFGGFGQSDAPHGELVMDTKTHSPSSIQMVCFHPAGNGDVTDIELVSRFNMGARDFKLF